MGKSFVRRCYRTRGGRYRSLPASRVAMLMTEMVADLGSAKKNGYSVCYSFGNIYIKILARLALVEQILNTTGLHFDGGEFCIWGSCEKRR